MEMGNAIVALKDPSVWCEQRSLECLPQYLAHNSSSPPEMDECPLTLEAKATQRVPSAKHICILQRCGVWQKMGIKLGHGPKAFEKQPD
jgi:hypothetical protein